MIDIPLWIVWLIAAIVFFLGEVFTEGFFLLWFAVGSLVGLLVTLFTDNIINIVDKCATILYKTKKQNLNKIAIKLQDEFENITIIVKEDTEENKSVILGINNKEYLVNSNDISTLVSEITILILENSETYLDTKSIESLIYKYFYEIRRA